MEITEENVKWAVQKMAKLRNLRGFPADGEQLRLAAEGFLRIVSCGEIKHPRLGLVEPADWLIQTISDNCEWFPSSARMRKIYSCFFKPSSCSVEVPVEEED